MRISTNSLPTLSVVPVVVSDTTKNSTTMNLLRATFWILSKWILHWFHLISAHGAMFSKKDKLWSTIWLSQMICRFLFVPLVIAVWPTTERPLEMLWQIIGGLEIFQRSFKI